MISFHIDQKTEIERNKIENKNYNNFNLSKNHQSQHIWKQIQKHVEKIVAVLTIEAALKLTHGNG